MIFYTLKAQFYSQGHNFGPICIFSKNFRNAIFKYKKTVIHYFFYCGKNSKIALKFDEITEIAKSNFKIQK